MNSNHAQEVEQLLLNAKLRDELEPFLDESIDLLTVRGKPTTFENAYLASMLAWERAPVLPIAEWFEPPLELPHPDTLDPPMLREKLWHTIELLFAKRVVLDFTDHLSDRELYCLILRDILPSLEKKLDGADTCLRWHCLDPTEDPETWLRFYATADERRAWQAETGEPLPGSEVPRFPRNLPRGD